MQHFHIIQALCRTALSQPGDAARQQVMRLRDTLEKEGKKKEAKALAGLLAGSERSIEMAPSKLKRSKAVFAGEQLTPNTPLPVNKETSTPLAEITFADQLPSAPPIFSPAIMQAIEAILSEWKHLEKIAAVDIEPVRSCLIYGLPGTGKTQLAMWMAKQLGLPVVSARLDGLVSSFLGTTSRNIGVLFNFADRYRCLLLLDEFDTIAKFRADPQEVGEIKRVVNTLLQSLDIRKNHGFTIGITNHEGLLDPAVWRRFDMQLEIPAPTLEAMMQIIIRQLPPVKIKESQIKFLAWLLDGKTGADVEVLTRWIKKSFAVSADFEHDFLNIVHQFVLLNGSRVREGRRQALMGDRENLLHELRRDLDLTQADIGEVLGQHRTTVSRAMSKKAVG